MRLVLVGGHSRNVGKTSVVEGLIRGLPEYSWTAVKITQHGHGICAVNGESCGCSAGEHLFAIDEECQRDTGTDSSRFLAAGARRALWVRTKQGELFTALPSLQREIQNEDFVIVESNSLRRFLKPTVYLQILNPASTDFKDSAQQFFDLADAYVLVLASRGFHASKVFEPWSQVSLQHELEKGKPCFQVTVGDRFLSAEVIEYVKQRLGAGSATTFPLT